MSILHININPTSQYLFLAGCKLIHKIAFNLNDPHNDTKCKKRKSKLKKEKLVTDQNFRQTWQ